MLLENYRDRQILKLYTMLTRSDMKGNLKDEYVICVLYALRCIDRCRDLYDPDPFESVVLAKEVIRVYDSIDIEEISHSSIHAITTAMFMKMKNEGLKYRDIHRMSTYDLVKSIKEMLMKEEGDEL